ncbi:MAG: hypothetical protein ACXAEX_14365 [Promethearchaeota archaeon]
MEMAVNVNEIVDSMGSYRSKLNSTAVICIHAPKAKNKIELDDLFMKNTTSGRIPRLKISTASGIKPVNIVPYIRVNSISSGLGTNGNNIPGTKKLIKYQRVPILLPIISRFAFLTSFFLFIRILPINNTIKEIKMMMSGI